MKKYLALTILLLFVSGCVQSQSKASVKSFNLDADDVGMYMNGKSINSLEVTKGELVSIVFHIKEDDVYYGGIDFRGCFDTIGGHAGETVQANFTATQNCTITSYWPASGQVKANLDIIVK